MNGTEKRDFTTMRYTIYEVTESDARRKAVPGAEYYLDLWYDDDNNGADAAEAALERVRCTDPGATFMVDQKLVVVRR